MVLTGCGGGGTTQQTPPPQASLTLSVSPATLTIYAGTTFTVAVNVGTTGTSATPTLVLGSLPMGLTSSATFPLNVPSSPAQIVLVADNSLSPGTYKILINGKAGTASASANLTATVQAGAPPAFWFVDPNSGSGSLSEAAVAPGGSATFKFNSYTNNQILADYDVHLSATGLPAGATASFSPSDTIFPGQSVTVTVNAAADAPDIQNATVTIVGTPAASVPAATVQFLLTTLGQAANNRTDYLSMQGSPGSAVYDPAHDIIYASNPTWNRIDAISNKTHTIVKSIPVPAPTSVDITQDGTQVWVATASQRVYAINTSTYAATMYELPGYIQFTNVGPEHWHGLQVLALSDRTLMLMLTTQSLGYSAGLGAARAAVWNPGSNTLLGIQPPGGGMFPAMWELVMRTGDGTKVYSIGEDSGGESFSYDVASKTLSQSVQLGGYAVSAAVNRDGSRVAVEDSNGLRMLDGTLSPVGWLPGGGIWPGFGGGLVFSRDGTTLYEEAMPGDIPFIYTIDAASLQARSIAPAMPMIPVLTQLSPSFYIPQPFAVDLTGMVLGLQDWGIAFEDATFAQNYATGQLGTPTLMQHMSPYSGPVSGGTSSSGFGNGATSTPHVWYGKNLGLAVSDTGTLSITSPSAEASGPVNLKMLFPDGREVFNPLFFAYGTVPEYAILSGASPDGGVPGQISGYGMPSDTGGGTVSVGGNFATITQASQTLPLTAAPFPETFLNFTIPAGSQGWADVSVTTPNGTGALPKSIFYAQSVKDYASNDQLHAVVYDENRQQLYLSTNGQIDVFSLISNQFVTTLTPPALGTQKMFAGMALTPDGLLLAANLTDGSLAVIDPDNQSNSYAVPIAAPTTQNSCVAGPLYVAAAANQQAFVVTGAFPGNGCGPGGVVYRVNLVAKTAVVNQNGLCGGGNVTSSRGGSVVALGENPQGYGSFCTYNVATDTYFSAGDWRTSAAISADGYVASAGTMLADANANTIGWVAQPAPYYQKRGGLADLLYAPLLQPKINDSGSLYYIPAANLVDIVDVQHGLTRMRFSLKQTLQNTASPIAIDSGGRHIYLITDAGLTIVDLGAAPLSIGRISPSVVASGTQVTIRGSGFAPGMTVTVGGEVASVSVTDENTSVIGVPVLSSGPQDVVLQLPDGETYKLENAITIP